MVIRLGPHSLEATKMPTAQMPTAPVAGAPISVLDDRFDLPITIVNDDDCVQSTDCDTNDGCSSTCPSACTSS
jgi:FxLD family lantipeptide